MDIVMESEWVYKKSVQFSIERWRTFLPFFKVTICWAWVVSLESMRNRYSWWVPVACAVFKSNCLAYILWTRRLQADKQLQKMAIESLKEPCGICLSLCNLPLQSPSFLCVSVSDRCVDTSTYTATSDGDCATRQVCISDNHEWDCVVGYVVMR